MIMNYYRHMDRTKIQFDFVIDGYGKSLLDDEITSLGGRIYKVEPYTHNIFKYMYQIYRIIRDNRYNIVHSNMNTLSVFSLFPAWLAGSEIRVVHNHSTAVKNEKIRSLCKYILRPLAPIFANNYAACSQLAGCWMYGKKLMNKHKVKIIRNAIDIDEFAFNEKKRTDIRHDLGIKNDDLVIGHVGRFVYQKNHEFLIKIFQDIYKKNSKAVLLLIGDGELRSSIEGKIKKYDLRNIKILGLRNDVKDLYNAMDFFVLPSWYEGLPVVSVEAQANGLSCFVSDTVSRECHLTHTIKLMSLSSGSEFWADEILKSDKKRNNSVKQELEENNYDIKRESNRMLKWYQSGCKEKEG